MRRDRGFTLLEVLIALTLLSLMMVAIVAAMRTLGQTRSALDAVTGRVDQVRIVSDFLRRNLEGVLPVVRIGAAQQQSAPPGQTGDTYFAGNSRELIWVAPLVAGANLGGAHVMRLAPANGRLVFSWRPYERDYTAFEEAELASRVLVESLSEFSIGYRATPGGEWLEEWPGQRFNPVAVKVNIRAGERYWPEIVVRLNGAPVNAR